jgi:hypothetical protein
MFQKILLYGLPIYLYCLELFLRTVAAVGSESLLGPTLAGAGIGFLLPLTDLKTVQVPQAVESELARLKAKVFSKRDKQLVDCIWVAFFISLVAWMYSVFLTFPPAQTSSTPSQLLPLLVGCGVFVLSIILSEIKERI